MSAPKRMLHDDSSSSLPKKSAYDINLFGGRGDAELTTDTWKDQLDFERDCTAERPGQLCWLSAELGAWNRVMHGLAFEIVEHEPGKLHLQSIRNAHGAIEKSMTATCREASFLLSWLLEHHMCVNRLSVFSHDTWRKQSFPIRLHSPLNRSPVLHMRCLEVSMSYFGANSISGDHALHWYALEGLDAVCGLEELKISTPKIKFKLAGELEALLRRNSSTLKAVEISKAKLPRNVSYALQCLTRCESLKLYLRDDGVHFASLVSVAQLLQMSAALKELRVYPIVDKSQVSVIADAVKADSSLKLLYMCFARKTCTPEPVFAAMEVNKALKELRVSDCAINATCGQALALALHKNCSLRDLYLANIVISTTSMEQLAGALLENTTLQQLHVSGQRLPMSGISTLCTVLTTNKSLKTLTFAGFQASKQEREALTKQMVEIDCYDRVRLPWIAADMPGLLAVLSSPSICPEELCLPNVQHLPEKDLKLLFDAISSSKRIHTFKSRFEGNLGERGTFLCQMLKANRSIKCLDIAVDNNSGNLVHGVLDALAVNKTIIELVIFIHPITEHTTIKHLTYFLAHNKMVTKLCLSSWSDLYSEFVQEFAAGLWQSKLILELYLDRDLLCDESSFTVYEALRRNRSILNRAVEFVVLPRADRQYAEAFELFFGKPCLLAHLIKVTGKTEAEALLALSSADHYLQDNYLIITGVIQNSVKCHPGNGTQFERLNSYCWRAIAQHLNLTDVLLP